MIEADLELCISAGMCALTAPAVFSQAIEDGHVIILDADPADPDDLEAAIEAVQLCPSGALSLHPPQDPAV
jgi:ferredoxin